MVVVYNLVCNINMVKFTDIVVNQSINLMKICFAQTLNYSYHNSVTLDICVYFHSLRIAKLI